MGGFISRSSTGSYLDHPSWIHQQHPWGPAVIETIAIFELFLWQKLVWKIQKLWHHRLYPHHPAWIHQRQTLRASGGWSKKWFYPGAKARQPYCNQCSENHFLILLHATTHTLIHPIYRIHTSFIPEIWRSCTNLLTVEDNGENRE